MTPEEFVAKWVSKISAAYQVSEDQYIATGNKMGPGGAPDYTYGFLMFAQLERAKREVAPTADDKRQMNAFNMYFRGTLLEDTAKYFAVPRKSLPHAIDSYEKALEYDPTYPASYDRLSLLYKKHRSRDELIALLEKGIERCANPRVTEKLRKRLSAAQ